GQSQQTVIIAIYQPARSTDRQEWPTIRQVLPGTAATMPPQVRSRCAIRPADPGQESGAASAQAGAHFMNLISSEPARGAHCRLGFALGPAIILLVGPVTTHATAQGVLMAGSGLC